MWEKGRLHAKTYLHSSVVGLELAKVAFPKHARVIDVILERGNSSFKTIISNVLEKNRKVGKLYYLIFCPWPQLSIAVGMVTNGWGIIFALMQHYKLESTELLIKEYKKEDDP